VWDWLIGDSCVSVTWWEGSFVSSGVGKQGMAFNWTSHWLERKEIKGEGAVALASEMNGVKSSYLGLLK